MRDKNNRDPDRAVLRRPKIPDLPFPNPKPRFSFLKSIASPVTVTHPGTGWAVPWSPRSVPGSHLLAVLAHVGVDLGERAHGVELVHVHAGLLGQVGVHVLVADCWHLGDV